MSRDVLMLLFNEARASRPPCARADEWQAWGRQMGQVLAAMPSATQAQSCALLIAQDLCRAMPGLPLSLALARMANLVIQAEMEEAAGPP